MRRAPGTAQERAAPPGSPLRGCAIAALLVALAGCPEAGPSTLQRRLDEAAPGTRLGLGPGRFAANLVVRRPLALVGEGPGRTVLAGTLTLAARGASVEGLTIDAGHEGTGLVVRADATARNVRVETDSLAVRVLEGARLTLEDAALTCHGEGRLSTAVSIAGSALEARNLAIDGSCRRGIDVVSGRLAVAGGTLVGARDAGVRMLGSEVALTDFAVALATSDDGAALFAARSQVTLARVTTLGGEHGLLVRGGHLEADDLSLSGARVAGAAFVGGGGRLNRLHLTGPFTNAAVLVTDAPEVVLTDLAIDAAGAVGVLALRARVSVSGARVGGLRCDREGDFGHAFVFDETSGRVENAVVSGAGGACVWASHASVGVENVEGRGVALGLAATNGAEISARGLSLDGGAALATLAWGASRIHLGPGRFAAPVAACEGSAVDALDGAVPGAWRRRTCRDDALGRSWKSALQAE